MTVRIFLTLGGYFVMDSNNKVKEFYSFSKDSNEIAQTIFNLERYLDSPELATFIKNNSEEKVITNSSLVQRYIRKNSDVKCEIDVESSEYHEVQAGIYQRLLDNNFAINELELQEINREVNIKLSKKRVTVASQRTDKMVVHAILSMDDITTTINLFMGRIREWYGIHFPEILKRVDNHETLCKMITEMGSRANYSPDKLKEYGFSQKKVERIFSVSRSSMGAIYDNKDLQPLQKFAAQTLELYQQKNYLEEWIDEQIDKIAPNMKAVIGSSITARLIALAGGLKEMAMMPSSTIQLLGAEKALFRALKTGAKPPKHGVIYQSPELHSCKWWQRGNIARAIAGKLTIAARIDAFQGEFRGNELKMELDQKIEEIKEKYKHPPKGKKEPQKSQNKSKGGRGKRSQKRR